MNHLGDRYGKLLMGNSRGLRLGLLHWHPPLQLFKPLEPWYAKRFNLSLKNTSDSCRATPSMSVTSSCLLFSNGLSAESVNTAALQGIYGVCPADLGNFPEGDFWGAWRTLGRVSVLIGG